MNTEQNKKIDKKCKKKKKKNQIKKWFHKNTFFFPNSQPANKYIVT